MYRPEIENQDDKSVADLDVTNGAYMCKYRIYHVIWHHLTMNEVEWCCILK